MTMIKHTGYNSKTKRKVVVVFRQIPEERQSALVVETESLMDRFHDGLMSATESAEGQATDNLYEVLNRRMFFDGEPMLQTLHSKGWLHKVDVNDIILSPAPNKEITLSEYNKTGEAVAEKDNSKDNQLNIDAATRPSAPQGKLTAEQELQGQAKNLIVQAQLLEEEARKKRAHAERTFPGINDETRRPKGRPKKGSPVSPLDSKSKADA
jgi:hypothetical protein